MAGRTPPWRHLDAGPGAMVTLGIKPMPGKSPELAKCALASFPAARDQPAPALSDRSAAKVRSLDRGREVGIIAPPVHRTAHEQGEPRGNTRSGGRGLPGRSDQRVGTRPIGRSDQVVERGPQHMPDGGGVGVDMALLSRVTGQPDGPPVCHGPDRDTTAWPACAPSFDR